MPGRGLVALDRALSKLGIASRAEARRRIAEGRVTVDGVVATDPSRLVVPERAAIRVDGRRAARARWRAIVLNKPRGTVTTRRDPQGRATVFDLLGAEGRSLVAVGRLDLATSGVLLLTTDTRLADRLADPATGIVRRYAVTVRGLVSGDSAARMVAGIAGLRARGVIVRKRSRRESHLIVELAEGKNREVRRLCLAVGHEVTKLTRIAFGGIELADLQPGQWRELTREAITRAFPELASAPEREL
jgi:23S rRNA pseudouridine2605 synthase